MRTGFIAALSGILLFSVPAMAGTIAVPDGKVTWESTQCVAPPAPESLVLAERHTPAEDLNTRITQYNQYVGLMQIYMDCVSNEAQNDANNAGQSIVKAAQDKIAAAQANLDKLGAPLKAKE